MKDAVAIVFHVNDEIFLVERQNYLKAFPGYHAFPGGKVDEKDRTISTHEHELFDRHDPIFMQALIRESKEEVGYDLKENSQNIKDISLFGIGVTPDFNPYRFNTHFYKVTLKEKPDFIVDEGEAKCSEWSGPKKLIDEYNEGKFLVVPPVLRIIEALAKDINQKNVENVDFIYDHEKEVPCIESIKGVRQALPYSNTLPPAQRTNCFVIGDEGSDVFIVDPAPKDEAELKKLINTVKKFRPTHIFLTHHHIDHHERSPLLAKELGLSFKLSEDSYERIKKKRGENYFGDALVEVVKDGDTLTKWNKKDVKIIAVPGHDEGQLALMPQTKEWCIVGDLIQGIGTVVIPPEEGDMKKYFASLQKIIDLDPQFIIPSHGIAMGSTFFITKALEHRQKREEDILALHQKGLNPTEIREKVYFDVPSKFHQLAQMNVDMHLKKLSEEGRL